MMITIMGELQDAKTSCDCQCDNGRSTCSWESQLFPKTLKFG